MAQAVLFIKQTPPKSFHWLFPVDTTVQESNAERARERDALITLVVSTEHVSGNY